MGYNQGKQFESIFKSQFKSSIPNSIIIRVYDTMNGYYGVHNLCDFIGYVHPNMFLLECKSHKGASCPFTAISQMDNLAPFVGVHGLRVGVVLYLYEKDKVYYIPIATLIQMKKDGKKSVGIKSIEEGYRIIEIPSVKKVVYLNSDYSILQDLEDGD